MFDFLKKKKAEPVIEQTQSATSEQEQRQEIKTFAAQFTGEETDLIAITAPSSVAHLPVGDTGLWRVAMGLTAWMDEYEGVVHQQAASLEAIIDDTLLDYLLTHVPRNFIISVTVRPHADGSRFLMVDLPKPGFDPELKAILEVQKAPVTMEVDDLGTFTLNRSLGWFEATVDWVENEISLTVDQAEDGREAALDTARTLLTDKESWHDRICSFAADTLLEQARGLLEDDEDLSREDFIAQMDVESVMTGADGTFEFWFGGDDLLLAHPVRVSGTLTDGPTDASMEP